MPFVLPPFFGDPAAPAVPCAVELRALDARYAEIRREIEMNCPFQERFATGAPDPATTAEVAGIVERALGHPDGGPGFQVECRANVCRVVAPPGIDGQRDWGLTLRRSTEFASRAGEQSTVGSGLIMFPLRHRPSGESKAVLVTLLKDFGAGPARDECWARHKQEGRLDVALWIGERDNYDDDVPTAPEALPNGIHLSAQGPLAATHAGRCLVDRLLDPARRAQVPKHGASAWQPTVFMLPPRRN